MSTPDAAKTDRRPIRLAYLVSHPIQYQVPLLRLLAKEPDIDLTVLFMSDFSVREYKDPGFGTAITWDVPLLGGYRHEFLPFRGKSQPVSGLNPWHLGIRSTLKKGGFDALWSHGYAHSTNLRFLGAARSLGIKTMVRAESQTASAEGTGLKRRAKEAVIRRIFSKIDAFLPIGTLNHDYYRLYGVPEEKLFTVPYTVDNEFFQSKVAAASNSRETLRSELGLEPGRPILLFASKLIARKRACDLVEAYAKLSADGKQEPRPYLLIIGDGDQRASLEARAAELGWSSIRFLGFKNQGDLPAFYDLCDVFVLPSEREPWGLIVNEVMNASRAVIVTREIGSTPDLVRDGVNGVIYDKGDIEQLAEALRRLTSDPKLSMEMGRKSLERVNEWGFKEDIAGMRNCLKYLLPSRFAQSTEGSGLP
jgi:glycosyltransferase involved in cell wall biosynthesis